MQLTLAGQIFAVTGAAQGIGAAIVTMLSESGATVAAMDIDENGLAPLADLRGVTCHAGDLGQQAGALDLCATVLDRYGRVDGLITAAGGVRGQIGRPLDQIDTADWQAIFAANVDAVMWCAQAFAPKMKANGAGRIVTISSGAGLKPSLTGIQAYTAAKHALVGLTKQLALELGPDGVTVNSVAPGFILSNPSTARQWQAFGPARQDSIINSIHLRRLGQASDIANAVAFLCSRQADWITGQILQVDGGHG